MHRRREDLKGDGSRGESGGIASNAIHFSVITRKSVHVRKTENIRLLSG